MNSAKKYFVSYFENITGNPQNIIINQHPLEWNRNKSNIIIWWRDLLKENYENDY